MIEALHLYNGVSVSYANLPLSAAGNRSAVGLGPTGVGKEKARLYLALLLPAVTAAVLRKKGAAVALA